MKARINKKIILKNRRKLRARKKIKGCSERPRLSICRTSYHISAQVIDDQKGHTLASIHSYGSSKRADVAACQELGKQLAKSCLEKSISKVVFDKNGCLYHGRIKAFADGAREGGLSF